MTAFWNFGKLYKSLKIFIYLRFTIYYRMNVKTLSYTLLFEFISNEHTRKNVMLVGSKTTKKADTKDINNKIKDLKDQYHIDFHYLEKQL